MSEFRNQICESREIINIDRGWKFKKGMDIAGFRPTLKDTNWEVVNVPHDWSIFGPFLEENPSGPRGGYAPGGIAWYRKTIQLPDSYKDKKIFIEFDGIYNNSEIHINGERVAKYPYGYTTQYYDITSYLNVGEDNCLAVKVNTSTQPSSRWYSGSGIYRHVRLIVTNGLHFNKWGTYIKTPKVGLDKALVEVEATITNEMKDAQDITVEVTIVDEEKNIVESNSQSLRMDGVSSLNQGLGQVTGDDKQHFGINNLKSEIKEIVTQSIEVKEPKLWSDKSPYLYEVISRILVDGKEVDIMQSNLGIRSIEFTADKGFFVNGEYTKLKGVCLHHDGGSLGAACPDRTKERQIEILKEMGCNAIRTSHNPPSPVLLDLCDKHGIYVIDEVFDEYKSGKRPRVFDEDNALGRQVRRPIFAYAEVFDEYHVEDITTMVLRDRNHPSIILWSIGNEISEHMTTAGVALTKELHSIVKEYDLTRPTITGIVHLAGANKLGIPDLVDVAGYNYKETLYEEEHKLYPDRVIMGSETSSAAPFEMRAVYDNFINQQTDITCYEDVTKEVGDIVSINSDHRFIRAEHSWYVTKSLNYISGLFIWTGFDYIGEPSPYAWPSKTSYFGVIDTCGFPKDAYYMYQSQWADKAMLHLFPHWNFEGMEGKTIPIWCYTNCDSVELFLNGESLGEKYLSDTQLLHLNWKVNYEAGELKAIGKKAGKVILEKVLETTKSESKIKLEADRTVIKADGQDLSYITVKVVDECNRLVPDARSKIEFEVSGDGKLVGVDNGDSTSLEDYKGNVRSALGGLCLAIVQSTSEAGEIMVSAKSNGLQGDSLVITTK